MLRFESAAVPLAALTPLPNESISLDGGGELNDAKVGLKRQTSGTLGERTASFGKMGGN
jgi:hypothetical protein